MEKTSDVTPLRRCMKSDLFFIHIGTIRQKVE
jgi:hypothetical protein